VLYSTTAAMVRRETGNKGRCMPSGGRAGGRSRVCACVRAGSTSFCAPVRGFGCCAEGSLPFPRHCPTPGRAVCACHLLVTDASLASRGDGGRPAEPVRIVACYEDFEKLVGLRQVVQDGNAHSVAPLSSAPPRFDRLRPSFPLG
jgi:hypothetical protein